MESRSSEYNGVPASQTNNRKQQLDLEMPGWFDQLTTYHETSAQPAVAEVTPPSQLQDVPLRQAKMTTGFLNKVGKLFGRPSVD